MLALHNEHVARKYICILHFTVINYWDTHWLDLNVLCCARGGTTRTEHCDFLINLFVVSYFMENHWIIVIFLSADDDNKSFSFTDLFRWKLTVFFWGFIIIIFFSILESFFFCPWFCFCSRVTIPSLSVFFLEYFKICLFVILNFVALLTMMVEGRTGTNRKRLC